MRTGFERSRRAIGLRRDGRPRLITMAIFKKPTLKTQPRKKRDIPQGLFQKCPGCNEVIHEIELNENLRVCPRCDYHFALSAKDRINNLLDSQTFVEMDADLKSVDTLRYHSMTANDSVSQPGAFLIILEAGFVTCHAFKKQPLDGFWIGVHF